MTLVSHPREKHAPRASAIGDMRAAAPGQRLAFCLCAALGYSPGMSKALRHFEDITPGEVIHAGPIEVTREAIMSFAQMYDPQPFHLDEAVAAKSLLGGLAASGWHTASIGMRLFYEGFVRHVASMGSPGVDELRWTRPVRPGDALSLVLTIGETRESASKPDRGYVATSFDIRNAAGETLMTQKCPVIVQRRGAGRPSRPHETASLSPAALRPPPADPMLAAPFDEIEAGYESHLGTQLFAPELITHFARLYDPQPFHVDAEAAATSHFGGLIASGWQTASFWMKHYVAARQRSREMREAAGHPVAIGGPSPGFAKLRWLRPVHAGEAISYGLTVTGKRRASRDGWGLVSTFNTGHAADGTLAFSFEGRLLWPT